MYPPSPAFCREARKTAIPLGRRAFYAGRHKGDYNAGGGTGFTAGSQGGSSAAYQQPRLYQLWGGTRIAEAAL